MVFKWRKKRGSEIYDLWVLLVVVIFKIHMNIIQFHLISEWYSEKIHWNFHSGAQYICKFYIHYMSALFRFALEFCLDKYFYKNHKTLCYKVLFIECNSWNNLFLLLWEITCLLYISIKCFGHERIFWCFYRTDVSNRYSILGHFTGSLCFFIET